MTRARLLILVAALLIGLAASAPARGGCHGHLGPLWGPILCETDGLATAWSVMDLREPPELAAERARFDARVAGCLHDRDERREADRAGAYACVRNRVWARTRALAIRSDPAAFTGRWLLEGDVARGEARILAIAPNSIRVDLRTMSRARGHVCSFALDDAWARDNEVAWKGVLEPGHPESECDFSLRRTGRASFALSSSGRCAWICGATGEYRGTYRLQP